MIKYLGSKRLLVGSIVDAVAAVPEARSVIDLFSGTSRVGHALKAAGFQVFSNDHNHYAETLARCYVEADAERVIDDATRLIDELNALPGRPGYVTETWCERAHFFQPQNGARIDAIRERIARLSLEPCLEAVLLTALMEAADRVDSTTGLQMAYLRQWAPRSFRPLSLRVPKVLPRATAGAGRAYRGDALDAVGRLSADVLYLDPPYNQHAYRANYHIWESLIRWDKPAVYGKAQKRVDCRAEQSPFNQRRNFEESLRRLIEESRARGVVISFSNEGFLSRERLEAVLRGARGGAGVLSCKEVEYPRYVGARIGIYNPRGEKVGRVSHLKNQEWLYTLRFDA